MDDRALYATILGITPPWDVARVELDDAAKAVHVWLEERPGTTFGCPGVRPCRRCMITWSGAGGTSIPASTRRGSTPACRVCAARSTG